MANVYTTRSIIGRTLRSGNPTSSPTTTVSSGTAGGGVEWATATPELVTVDRPVKVKGNQLDNNDAYIPLVTGLTFNGNTLIEGNIGDKIDQIDLTIDSAYTDESLALTITGNSKVYGNTILKGRKTDRVDILDETLEAEYLPESLVLTVSGNTKLYGNLEVVGQIKASKDVIAYFATETETAILDALTVTQPLEKTGTNVALNYNPAQFEVLSGTTLSIIESILGGSGSVAWADVTGKPTEFTPAAHTQDWSTITGKPATFTPSSGSTSYIQNQNSSAQTADFWINGSGIFNTTIQAATAKFTNLSDGYLPYHVSDASGLANSPVYTDGTNIGIGTTTPYSKLDIFNSDITSTTYRSTVVLGLGSQLIFRNKITTSGANTIASIQLNTESTAGTESGGIVFNTKPSTASTALVEAMRLNASGTLSLSSLTGSNNRLTIANSTGTLSTIADGANGTVLKTNGSGTYSFGTLAYSALTGTPTLLSQFTNDLGNYGGFAYSSDITSHTTNTSNPHSVTKTQVGLSSVDNTSDAGKPVSTATQTALNAKAALAGSLSQAFNASSLTLLGSTYNWSLTGSTGSLVFGHYGGNITFSAGGITAAGDVTAFSDRRLKTEVKPLKVRGELNPVTYIKDGKESIGFIAQEVKELYPELVKGEGEEMLSLNYMQLTAVLYAEIIELKKQIKELRGLL